MAVPNFQEFMLPVLKLGAEGVISVRDASKKVADVMDLSEEDRQETVASGQETRVMNRTAWAISHLYQASLLKRPQRGFFTITDQGQKVLAENPEKIDMKFLEKFPEYQAFQQRKRAKPNLSGEDDSQDSGTPKERITLAYEEILAALKGEMLERIQNASPEFFEKLVINLLIAMGYGGSEEDVGEHLGKPSDGGIDGLVKQDKLGLDTIYVQAKRYASDNTVGSPDVQGFSGALDAKGASKGVFFTTSSFSKSAKEYVERVQKQLVLVDGEELVSLMIDNNVGVREDYKIELKRIDDDFFDDE